MLDRRRARSTSLRMLPEEGRRSSFWIPAFITAVAANECGEAAMVRAAEGDALREVLMLWLPPGCGLEARGDCSGEGGSVFKSGAMEGSGVISCTMEGSLGDTKSQ